VSGPINTGFSPARQLCTEKMHLDWTGSCCYTYCVDGSYRALGDLYLGICRITIMMWQFNHDSTDYGLPPVICLPENGLYYPQNGHQDLARMLIMITLPITYLRHLHHLVVTSSLVPMLLLACWLGYAGILVSLLSGYIPLSIIAASIVDPDPQSTGSPALLSSVYLLSCSLNVGHLLLALLGQGVR